MSSIFEKINELSNQTENEFITRHKSEGKKVVGFFCSYIPEEIFTAANIIPYRMRGVNSGGTELADAYYSTRNCTFPRSVLNKMLKGEYDFLDGIVFMNGCDHTRRMYDIVRHIDPNYQKFIHFVDVPHVIGDVYLDKYFDVLKDFILKIETYFNIKISEEALRKAATLHNKKRALLKQVHELRKSSNISVKGSEVLKLTLAVTFVPVETAISLIEEFITAVNERKLTNAREIRIVVAGGCLEDVTHLEMIESLGASIVVDNTCLGVRYTDTCINHSGDIVFNLAKGYLEHLSCARMTNGYEQRLSFVEKAYKEYNADGVIFEKLTFCVLYCGEMYLYRQESKKHSYPLLVLEKEYADKAEGQIKTRVQAFLEGIKNTKNK